MNTKIYTLGINNPHTICLRTEYITDEINFMLSLIFSMEAVTVRERHLNMVVMEKIINNKR